MIFCLSTKTISNRPLTPSLHSKTISAEEIVSLKNKSSDQIDCKSVKFILPSTNQQAPILEKANQRLFILQNAVKRDKV